MGIIDFACKRVSIEQIIKCSFAFTKTDYLIFKILMNEKKKISIADLKKKVGKDRTTIQKSIKNLIKKNIVSRYQVNIYSGGYLYYYSIREKEEIKKKIRLIFDSWQGKVIDEINNW